MHHCVLVVCSVIQVDVTFMKCWCPNFVPGHLALIWGEEYKLTLWGCEDRHRLWKWIRWGFFSLKTQPVRQFCPALLKCPPSFLSPLSLNFLSSTHSQLTTMKPLALCLCSTGIQYLPVDVSLTTRGSLRCLNGWQTIFSLCCAVCD